MSPKISNGLKGFDVGKMKEKLIITINYELRRHHWLYDTSPQSKNEELLLKQAGFCLVYLFYLSYHFLIIHQIK